MLLGNKSPGKSKKGNSRSSIIVDSNTITDPTETGENFNNFFQVNRTESPKKSLLLRKLLQIYFEKLTISPASADEISDSICSLDSNKSIGVCSMATKILKIPKEIVSLPLSQLINNCISNGIFPNICKLAQVIPIFKNDSRLLCNNYRLIWFLSNISKIFEKLIHCGLNVFLEQNNCLYLYQFGFRLSYSVNNALMTIVESIQNN